MTKLIIQHLWSDFKKHWLGILVTLVLCYIATIFVFTFGFWFFICLLYTSPSPRD